MLPPEGKQRFLYLRVQGLFTLRIVCLMQMSVALGLHFGWDSQLNTSEMFWIDISRLMIRSRCRWISVYLPWCMIRPKRIYNLCLLHACFVRLCHVLDELSYTLVIFGLTY